MGRTVTTVLDGFSYLECPRWHEGRIWFSDFYRLQVFSANEDGSDLRVEADVPQQPSGLGWLPDGRLLVVSMRDRRILRREPDGSLVTHADLSSKVDAHLNDMVVDRHGRAYVGNFGFDLMNAAPVEATDLIRVDPDGTVTVVAENLLFPNGSVITEDNILLVDEAVGNRVTAFDITTDGSLANRRTWAEFGSAPTEKDLMAVLGQLSVGPDGCTLDAEGALWVADALKGRLLRVREGGEIVEEINPGIGVFACALGGSDGKTLFACAAPDFNEYARKEAREGSLLAIRVDVPGAGI